MPIIPSKQSKLSATAPLRLAVIYWPTSSVGGIATHLNALRKAAITRGDSCDILLSASLKTKTANKFSERKWIRGGDTNIWIDGEAPHHPNNVRETIRWLEKNYDAVCFGFICPHETKAYPTPDFLPLYETKLPKIAWVMDGYWEEYAHWAEPLLTRLKGVLCPLESYATPLRSLGVENLAISAFPFNPPVGKTEARSKTPLLSWINQWKNIKGVTEFIKVVPALNRLATVELYSCGIRYYQLRTTPEWKAAVWKDKFKGFDGNGKATYFGNVDLPEVFKALQRSWFTVNLQGMKSKKVTYKRGSYNNTEVEALYCGACPILHSSTLGTDLPKDVYIQVDSAEEIPTKVKNAISSGFAIDPARQRRARDFIIQKHLAKDRYMDLRNLLTA